MEADAGCISHRTESGYLSPTVVETLAGYSRAGENRGVVMTDEELSQPIAIRSPDAARTRIRAGMRGMAKASLDVMGRKLRQAAGWNIQVTP